MDIFTAYATNPALEEEGKEFDWGGGLKLLIGRSYNSKYKRMLNARYEAFKHILDQKDTPEQIKAAEETSDKIMAEVMACSVLLGWTGPMEFKGQPLPYSVANAQMLLGIKEFQKEIARKADDFRNFRFEQEEADTKNSSTTSSGT